MSDSDNAEENRKPAGNKQAGKGVIAIAGAKLWFIVTSYAIVLTLPQVLTAAEFGQYRAALMGVSMLNNVLIVATIQSVAKFVSEDEESTPALLRQALGIQAALGGLIAALLFSGAPLLAEEVLKDPALTPLLRIASVVVFVYSLYGAVVGSLNGRRLFLRQAGLDVSFSTLRSVGIIAGAIVGGAALPALVGWAGAAIVITLSGFWVLRRELAEDEGKRLPIKRWIGFMAPVWLYQLALNGMLLIDVQVIKRTVADVAAATGATAEAAAVAASETVGYYAAAQTFALVPYQLILALTFVVFPMVSRAASAGDEAEAQKTIRGALRFALIVLFLMAAPISGAAEGVMRIAYPEEYLVGAPALELLVFGTAAMGLFVVCATILSSIGRPLTAAIVAGLSVIVTVLLVHQGIVSPPEAGVMAGAARGTATGMVLALVLSLAVVASRYGFPFPPLTVLRVAGASAASWGVAHALPTGSRLVAFGTLVVGALAYLAALVLTGELGKAEAAMVLGALRRRKS